MKRQRLKENSDTETFVVWLQVSKGTTKQHIQEVLEKSLPQEFTAVVHPNLDEEFLESDDDEGTEDEDYLGQDSDVDDDVEEEEDDISDEELSNLVHTEVTVEKGRISQRTPGGENSMTGGISEDLTSTVTGSTSGSSSSSETDEVFKKLSETLEKALDTFERIEPGLFKVVTLEEMPDLESDHLNCLLIARVCHAWVKMMGRSAVQPHYNDFRKSLEKDSVFKEVSNDTQKCGLVILLLNQEMNAGRSQRVFGVPKEPSVNSLSRAHTKLQKAQASSQIERVITRITPRMESTCNKMK